MLDYNNRFLCQMIYGVDSVDEDDDNDDVIVMMRYYVEEYLRKR